jgi:hypothetical protein
MSITSMAGTLIAALAGSVVGIFFVLPLGLVVSEFVIFPLAVGVAAILSSLAAGWTANALSRDGTRTHLAQVVLTTEAVAALLAVLFLANAALRLVLLGPIIYVALFCVAALAIASTISTGRLRSEQRNGRDGLLTLGLMAVAILSIPATIFLAWLAGATGA